MKNIIVKQASKVAIYAAILNFGIMAGPVSAANIDGDMLLRDAVYLYNQPISSLSELEIIGSDCDVFQLVFDVISGHTDLWISQGAQQRVLYQDTIFDWQAMFSYSLYGSDKWKTFAFSDRDKSVPEIEIGRATVFGYCYSTKSNAYVYKLNQKDNSCTYSNGFVESNCL